MECVAFSLIALSAIMILIFFIPERKLSEYEYSDIRDYINEVPESREMIESMFEKGHITKDEYGTIINKFHTIRLKRRVLGQ